MNTEQYQDEDEVYTVLELKSESTPLKFKLLGDTNKKSESLDESTLFPKDKIVIIKKGTFRNYDTMDILEEKIYIIGNEINNDNDKQVQIKKVDYCDTQPKNICKIYVKEMLTALKLISVLVLR